MMSGSSDHTNEIAFRLIAAALESGVKGQLRELLLEAERLAKFGAAQQSPSEEDYSSLVLGDSLSDPQRPGLLMRHNTNLGKVWIFSFQHPNTQKNEEIELGRFPDVPLTLARSLWDRLKDLAGERQDIEVSSRDRVDPKSPISINELCSIYIEKYARKVKRSWREDERMLQRHLIPDYGYIQATAFTHVEATELLERIHSSGTHREAEKVRSVVQTMFNVASGRTRKISMLGGTWLPPDTENPVKNVFLPIHKPKNHKPSEAELRNYMRGLGALHCGPVLMVQAYTMSRISEVTKMTWQELDLSTGRWVLPGQRAKNGNEHVVLLPNQAVEILVKQMDTQQRTGIISNFVFSSPRDTARPRSPVSVQQQIATHRLGLGVSPKFTSHSLRHAGLTWAAENGCPREVRDRLTNHVSGGGIDSVYNAATHSSAAREWWQKWADYLQHLLIR
ncbi:tyrosine-type recombinase/integrase [Tropicimonas sediminicola]|uniref:Integrase n=1 Tax=Tropicimonas sediminicola TaxID=1031541 RepID=A0A239M372_9RHOB|nr:site-specific integrase [Tropicimonas sediminicola]SNT36732.1 Integrase [Tropicimonas sediminicola]